LAEGQAHPFHFDQPAALTESLRGAAVLQHLLDSLQRNEPGFQHAVAVENTLTLFEAAKQAGVSRGTHQHHQSVRKFAVGVLQRQAVLERVEDSGLSYAACAPMCSSGTKIF
jgi:NADH dehydrogenase